VLSQLRLLLPPGVGTAQVEALAAEVQKAQEHSQQSPGTSGPTQVQRAATDTPTLDELRRLHQKFEKHEEQVERAQKKVDKCAEQIAQLQQELARHQEHLEDRKEVRDAAKKAFDEADLRHRVERPVGTSVEDSELHDASQVIAATAWVAAKAQNAGSEKPPREILRTFRSLRQVWNQFGSLDFETSSDEEDDEDGSDDSHNDEASDREANMEEDNSDKGDKSGNSTPKGASLAPASPLQGEGSVSGGKPRLEDSGERLAKLAKTEKMEGVGPMATTFHQRYPAQALPALVLPRARTRRGRSDGKGGSPSRSRSPGPTYQSPAADSDPGLPGAK
jgi:division protein CdvB (Snf7/Vps24/ESCRT-III family)